VTTFGTMSFVVPPRSGRKSFRATPDLRGGRVVPGARDPGLPPMGRVTTTTESRRNTSAKPLINQTLNLQTETPLLILHLRHKRTDGRMDEETRLLDGV